MNVADLRKRVRELHHVVGGAAAGHPTAAADGLYVPQPSTADLPVEDSLDLLRLKIKYLLLDLEATRRENRYLRQMLDTRPHSEGDGSDGGKF